MALNVEVVPREIQTVPARTTHWSADETVAKGRSLFTNMLTCQRVIRIECLHVSKTSRRCLRSFLSMSRKTLKQMPTKLGHELEGAELSVLVVGQDEHDVGS